MPNNNTLGTAVNLGILGSLQTFSDVVGTDDRNDYYKFNLNEVSQVNFNLSSLSEPAQLSMVVDFDNDGILDYSEDIANDDISDGSNSIANRSISRTLGAGTYGLRVYTAYDSQNTAYTLSAAATATPPATTPDPGNTIPTARDIGVLGSTQTFGNFVGSLDRNDYYKFNLNEVSQVNFNLSSLSEPAQLSMVVDFDNDGILDYSEDIANDDISDGSNSIANRSISRTLGAGTYGLRVYTAYDSQNTAYTLSAAATATPPATTPDPGNTIPTARDIGVLGSTQTFGNFVGSLDRNDYYKFNLNEVSQVNFNLSSLSEPAQLSMVVDFDNDGILDYSEDIANDDISDGSNSIANRSISRTLGAGTYGLRVYTAYDSQNTSYTLSAAATATPPATTPDPGNTIPTARDIGVLGSTQTFGNFVGSLDRNDYYRFQITQASQVSLNLDTLNQDAEVELAADVNNNGQIDYGEVLRTANLYGTGDRIINLTTGLGDYFIRVFTDSPGYNTPYTLTASATAASNPDSAGNTVGTARDLGVFSGTQTFSDVVGEGDRTDYYRLEFDTSSIFSLNLSGFQDSTRIYLLDQQGQTIWSNTSYSLAGKTLPQRMLDAGVYFVRIDGTGNATPYNLTVDAIASLDGAGNTLNTARNVGVLTSSQTFSDFVGNIDPNDYYRFELAADGSLNLALSGEVSGTDAYLRLLDSRGVQIRRSSSALNLNLFAGTYYAQVVQSYGETNYNLALSSTAIPDRAGNTSDAAKNLSILTGSQTFSDFVGDIDPNDYYRFELLRDSTIQLTLNGLSSDADLALSNSAGTVINRSTRAGSSADAITEELEAGVYYVRVYEYSGSTNYNLAVTATPNSTVTPLQIQSVTPDSGSNSGQATLTLTGTQFTPNTTVRLIDPAGNSRSASQVLWQSDRTLTATFNLSGLGAGQYDVAVTDGGNTATASDIFAVNSQPPGQLEVTLSVPGAVRSWWTGEVVVNYRNTGETDIVAPLLNLEAIGAKLRLPGETEFGDGSVQVLGISQNGFAGVLPPGASGSFTVLFQPTGNANNIDFTVSTVAANEPVDWNALKATAKPDDITPAAWDKIWNNFTASVGTTAGSYQAVLAENATALSQLGDYTNDVSRLLSFELQQSSDYQNLAQREGTGSLGLGWSFPGDMRLVTDSQGNVTLQNSGAQRTFARQADGSYRGEDDGILTLQGTTFQLQESDGTIVTFRDDGRLNTVRDTNDNQITAVYTGTQLTRFDRSNGDTLSFTYNPQGRISTITDQAGRSVTYGYNSTGDRLSSVIDANGTLSYTYNSDNALTGITYPDGTQASFEYDSQGRLSRQSLNNGVESLAYTYDSSGGITLTDGTSAQTKLWLNDRGQIGRMQDAQGRVVQFRYDDTGNLTRIVAPNDTITGFSYDDQGNLISQTNALGQRIEFTYEPNFDQLQSVTDARGNPLQFSYDDRGNLTGTTYADGSQETYSYDAQGNVTVAINRRNQTIQYTYDTKGQLIRKDFPDGTTATYTYDDRGNLTTATDADSSVTYAYDSGDRLTKVTDGSSRFVQFTYDAGGRRSRMVDQDGFAVNYRYDTAGRLTELTDDSNQRIVLYTYDAVGRLSREDNGNGTYTTYGYDTAGQLLSLVNYKADNTVNSRFDYTYDALGRRTSATTLEGTTTYGYDAIGQLANVTLPGGRFIQYQYDAAGNRVSVTDSGATTAYSTNTLNQYNTVGAATYTYDPDGNLAAKTENGVTSTYAYDSENRLISVTNPDGTWTYEYDATGNRIATVFNGQRTEYLLDPTGLGDVVGEYSGSNLVARYTHGLGLVSRVDASTTAYYDADAIGSTTGITDATGTYLNQYRYLPFGESLSKTETLTNPFEYVGQWGVMDEGNGLTFMRARFYDGAIGRFTAADPIGLLGGFNLYSYSANDPISLIDPQGTLPFIVFPIIGSILGVGTYYGTSQLESKETTLGGYVGSAIVGAFGGATFRTLATLESFSANALVGILGTVFGNIVPILIDGPGSLPKTEKERQDAINDFNLNLGLSILGPLVPSITKFKNELGQFISETLQSNSYSPGIKLANDLLNSGSDDIYLLIDAAGTRIVTAIDPNDIIGPAGVGTEGWILPNQVMPYMIRFENQPSATAPAVLVTVTQQLDADLDWTTFELGDFGFGNLYINVPKGLQSYSKRVAIEGSYSVDFNANLDITTGEVKWELRTVDASGNLPEDPLAGFLPPNNANHDGEGFVNYRIKPKASSGNGTSLTAEASIVFDTNAPIQTPVWLNRIDLEKPTSAVNALASTTEGEAISVSWAGSDDGSGVASYDVFVSTDSSAFSLWLDDTTQTAATYTGQIGRTYAFYSVATDNLGYTETASSQADTVTTLIAASTPPLTPTLTWNAANSTFSTNGSQSNLLLTLTRRTTDLLNEIGLFKVDDAQGTIDGTAPGASGYLEKALTRSQVVFSALNNSPNGFTTSPDRTMLLNASSHYRFYLVQNSTTDAVLSGQTSLDRVSLSSISSLRVTNPSINEYILSWEDGSGSQDFTDLVIQAQLTQQSMPMGAALQGSPQSELLDFRTLTGEQIRAEFTIHREAALNNYVGFYQINNTQGEVVDPLTGATLTPGQSGYIEAATRNRVAGIDLAVANQSTAMTFGIFAGGALYAPFIIVNGRPDQILDTDLNNNPAVYFPFLGANSDKVDHIRVLGDNLFGFEDLLGGGDFDYNDMVIRVNPTLI